MLMWNWSIQKMSSTILAQNVQKLSIGNLKWINIFRGTNMTNNYSIFIWVALCLSVFSNILCWISFFIYNDISSPMLLFPISCTWIAYKSLKGVKSFLMSKLDVIVIVTISGQLWVYFHLIGHNWYYTQNFRPLLPFLLGNLNFMFTNTQKCI